MPFSIIRDDIARVSADAIVVAANESLIITGGVTGCVAQAAGRANLEAACRARGGCPTGSAVVTPAFDLPARMIVHAVGPVWGAGGPRQQAQLNSAYASALEVAWQSGATSIALPLLSAGTYGCPPAVSLAAARVQVANFLEKHDADVTLVVYDQPAFAAAVENYGQITAYIDSRFHGEWADAAPSMVLSALESAESSCPVAHDPASEALEDLLARVDASFSQTLLALIDARDLTDAQVYRRANISRQLFSKIRSNPAYSPKKRTVLALALALELDLAATQDLLARAGFTLTHSSKADLVVECFITHGIFSVMKVNEVLFAFDMPLLSRLSIISLRQIVQFKVAKARL